MAINYNKLWKLLIDKSMNKKDLGRVHTIRMGIFASLIFRHLRSVSADIAMLYIKRARRKMVE